MTEDLMRLRFARQTGCLAVTVEPVRASKDRGKVHYLVLTDSNIKIVILLICPHPDMIEAFMNFWLTCS